MVPERIPLDIQRKIIESHLSVIIIVEGNPDKSNYEMAYRGLRHRAKCLQPAYSRLGQLTPPIG